jgi:hypothetical protein
MLPTNNNMMPAVQAKMDAKPATFHAKLWNEGG